MRAPQLARFSFAFIGAVGGPQCGWAAPPLIADDASTLAPGSCQFETERRRFLRRVELDLVPACNFLFDAEIGIGKLRVTPDAMAPIDSVVYQFKKVVVPAPADEPGWALGLTGASVRASGSQSGTRLNLLTASLSRQAAAGALHLNLGLIDDREAAAGQPRRRWTWAVAGEHDAGARWTLVGEVVGQQDAPAIAQAGLRWWALPKYIQFTSSLGVQRGLGRAGRWASVGVRFETPDSLF